VSFRITLSDLAKYSTTRSVARSLCDGWASCYLLLREHEFMRKLLEILSPRDYHQRNLKTGTRTLAWPCPTIAVVRPRGGVKHPHCPPDPLTSKPLASPLPTRGDTPGEISPGGHLPQPLMRYGCRCLFIIEF